jgi:hypothetical protein
MDFIKRLEVTTSSKSTPLSVDMTSVDSSDVPTCKPCLSGPMQINLDTNLNSHFDMTTVDLPVVPTWKPCLSEPMQINLDTNLHSHVKVCLHNIICCRLSLSWLTFDLIPYHINYTHAEWLHSTPFGLQCRK